MTLKPMTKESNTVRLIKDLALREAMSAQFGAVEMGGMFSVVKVRDGLASGDYKDHGWFKHPPGTVAYEYTGPVAPPPRSDAGGGTSMALKSPAKPGAPATQVRARKPSGHSGH